MSFLLNNIARSINYFASQTINHPQPILRAVFTIGLYEAVKRLTKKVYDYSLEIFNSYKTKQTTKEKTLEMLSCTLCLAQHASHVKKSDRIASEIFNKDLTKTNNIDDSEKKKLGA